MYGGIHIRSSHISMGGFISGVHMYIWRNSYREFTYIYGGIHI